MRIFSASDLARDAAASLFAQAPEITFDSAPNFLKLPDRLYMGEAAGVATNSKGHVYVYTRTGDPYATTGTSRTFTHGGSRLFEFDQNGKYVGEIGQNSYGFLVAQAVRVDPQDNIWVVDKMSSLVIKFAPDGRVLMPSRPQARSDFRRDARRRSGCGTRRSGRAGTRRRSPPPPPGSGQPGDLFNGPTDVAWDAQGNIFISDGFGNARIAKFDKNGKYIKSWGSQRLGAWPVQQSALARHRRSRQRVCRRQRQSAGFRCSITTARSRRRSPAWARPPPSAFRRARIRSCTRPNSNEVNSLDHGEIYKMELDGKVLGQFGRAGHVLKEFGAVNEIDCRHANELLVGELMNWRVQKITLH